MPENWDAKIISKTVKEKAKKNEKKNVRVHQIWIIVNLNE